MEIERLQDLDSLARESSRQFQYYRTRNPDLAKFWQHLSMTANMAMLNGTRLLIEEAVENPIPIIKPGAQGVKVWNPGEEQ